VRARAANGNELFAAHVLIESGRGKRKRAIHEGMRPEIRTCRRGQRRFGCRTRLARASTIAVIAREPLNKPILRAGARLLFVLSRASGLMPFRCAEGERLNATQSE